VDAVSDSGVAIGNTPGSDTSYTTYDVTTGSTTIVNFAPPGGIGFSIGGINSSGAIAATQYTAVMKRKPKTACEPFEQGADGSYTWLAQSHLSGLGSVGLTDDGRVVMGRSLQCEGTGAADYFSYENGKKKKITFPGMSSLGVYFVTGSGFGGYFYTADNQQEFGFASTDRRKITTYATPPGSTAIVVTAIGPKNKVAGYAIAPSGYFHGFIYVGKSYHSIDYPNQKSTIITGFSSTGAIIGYFGDGKAINGYPKQPFIATCASDKGCTQ
jgi:hypothetical protein